MLTKLLKAIKNIPIKPVAVGIVSAIGFWLIFDSIKGIEITKKMC